MGCMQCLVAQGQLLVGSRCAKERELGGGWGNVREGKIKLHLRTKGPNNQRLFMMMLVGKGN